MYFLQTLASLLYRALCIDNEESTEEDPRIVTEHFFVTSPDCKYDHHSVHLCCTLITNYLKEIDFPP